MLVCLYVVFLFFLYFLFFCFFFQAEDGIRDLVRSRGLGDVYKRQELAYLVGLSRQRVNEALTALAAQGAIPVSYTHLTLPTSDLV